LFFILDRGFCSVSNKTKKKKVKKETLVVPEDSDEGEDEKLP